jgi:hypothetical protein
VVATVVATREFFAGQRKLFVVTRIGTHDFVDDFIDGKPDAPDQLANFATLTATVVNIGARPIGVGTVGIIMRPRNRSPLHAVLRYPRERRQKVRQDGVPLVRDYRLRVPMVDQDDDLDCFPSVLSDGESVTASWSLIRPPFATFEPRGIFVDDATGKRRSFRIPSRVRREANRRTGELQRQIDPNSQTRSSRWRLNT